MDTHVAATINSLLRTYIIIMHTSVHALTCMNLHLLDQGCHAMQILRASDCVFYFFYRFEITRYNGEDVTSGSAVSLQELVCFSFCASNVFFKFVEMPVQMCQYSGRLNTVRLCYCSPIAIFHVIHV